MTPLTTQALVPLLTFVTLVAVIFALTVALLRRAARGTGLRRWFATAGGTACVAVLGGAVWVVVQLTAEWPSNAALARVSAVHPPFRPVLDPQDPPAGFPRVRTTSRAGMQPGTVLIATSTTPRSTDTTVFHPPFLAEIDKATGDVVKAQRMFAMTSMFQPEPGERYSYNVVDRNGRDGAGFHVTHYVTDDRLQVLEQFDLDDLEGGDADLHDFELLDNGNALLLAYRRRQADLSAYGGGADAMVYDPIIAERTPEGRTVWLWDGSEHLDLDDVPPANVKLKLQAQPPAVADYAHPNSLELYDDGDILLSVRNYDCIHRIDRQTGDIVWTFGGVNCADNEFDITGDPYDGFSHQHDATLLEDGNILLFDNGNLHDPPRSRVVEYAIDEQARTAELVWSHDDGRFTGYFGSAGRLDNGNTLISWGALHDPLVTEVTPAGERVFTLSLPPGQRTYRAYQGATD
ncbi:MAG TPA: aryl-sulfate sulfotransferase [Euzebyales bacterium]|nr:aryl-sulfate sulfotransferase [Euzebyales bacterium]